MRAARLVQGEIQIQDLPPPTPKPDEALIRMSSAGVCHSDLHIARGDWDGLPSSMPLGHEGIGIVATLGPGAERYVAVGDRVILGLGGTGGGFWCGACEYCLRGDPRHCAQAKGIMGTFSQEFCVYAKSLVQLPDSVGDEEAALACGGLTAYGAVKKLLKHHILPGRRIAVIGAAGGLGHYAVQIASAFGYKVVGVDIGVERLAFVESLGAHTVLSADDAVDAVQSFGGVDACLVFSAKLAGFTLGLQMLRRGGLFVAVGIPARSSRTSSTDDQRHPGPSVATAPERPAAALSAAWHQRDGLRASRRRVAGRHRSRRAPARRRSRARQRPQDAPLSSTVTTRTCRRTGERSGSTATTSSRSKDSTSAVASPRSWPDVSAHAAAWSVTSSTPSPRPRSTTPASSPCAGRPASSVATPAFAVTSHHCGLVSPARGCGQPSVTTRPNATPSAVSVASPRSWKAGQYDAPSAASSGSTSATEARGSLRVDRRPSGHGVSVRPRPCPSRRAGQDADRRAGGVARRCPR